MTKRDAEYRPSIDDYAAYSGLRYAWASGAFRHLCGKGNGTLLASQWKLPYRHRAHLHQSLQYPPASTLHRSIQRGQGHREQRIRDPLANPVSLFGNQPSEYNLSSVATSCFVDIKMNSAMILSLPSQRTAAILISSGLIPKRIS